MNKKIYFNLSLIIFITILISIICINKQEFFNSWDGLTYFYNAIKILENHQGIYLLFFPITIYFSGIIAITLSIIGDSLIVMSTYYYFLMFILNIMGVLIYYYVGSKITNNKFYGILLSSLYLTIRSHEIWLGPIYPLPSTITFLFLPLLMYYLTNPRMNNNFFKGIIIIFTFFVIHPWELIFIIPIFLLFLFQNNKKLFYGLILIFLIIFSILNKYTIDYLISMFNFNLYNINSLDLVLLIPTTILSFLSFFIIINQWKKLNPFWKYLCLFEISFLIIFIFLPNNSKRFILFFNQISIFLSLLFICKSFFNKKIKVIILFIILILGIIGAVNNASLYSQRDITSEYELEAFENLKETNPESYIISDPNTFKISRFISRKYGLDPNEEQLNKIRIIFQTSDWDMQQKEFLCISYEDFFGYSHKIEFIVISSRTTDWIINKHLSYSPVYNWYELPSEKKFLKELDIYYSNEYVHIYRIPDNFCQNIPKELIKSYTLKEEILLMLGRKI